MSDNPPKMSGAFLVNPNGTHELEVILHLNPKHKKYKTFIELLQIVQKKDTGLITYSSGI